ncbi:MAG: PAS domain S-box protein [Methanolinea sp.]|jgi:PAS domain S-box-containing protein|nr:PAS domain S-box protein [Methanolinea sp.]
MAENGGDRRQKRSHLFSFSHYLLFSMIFLILIMAAGITYFDYRQAEETYQKSARAMQDQTEADIIQTIRVVDSAYEIYDNSLNIQMLNGFTLFLGEYERAGGDPSRMNLHALKEEMGNTMDLYMINESLMIEYTTYGPDLGLDFSQWPHSYNFLKDLIQKEGFFPDRVVYEVASGKLRKYAYMPTPDHRYILELGLTEKGIGDRPAVQYQEPLREMAFHNPNILSYRAFDTVGRLIGKGSNSKKEALAIVKQVIEEKRTIELEDPGNNTIIRYLLVDLSEESYASDTSWIIELVYDQSEMKAQLSNLVFFHLLVALVAVVLSAGIALVLSRHLTMPVKKMVDDIDTISKGNLDHAISHTDTVEFMRIEESIASLVGTLKGMIERLQQSEHELKRSEENYRTVVENQNELIARFLPDGTHVFVNDAYCTYFETPCSELLGKKMWPRIPDEDRILLTQHFSSLTPESPAATIEHRIITHKGEVRWLQWNDRAIFGPDRKITEYQSVGRDVTEKKQIEQELIESERKFRDLASLLPQVIFEIDLEGRIDYVNQPAYHMFGYSHDDVRSGVNFTQVILPKDRMEAIRNFQNVLEGKKDAGAEYHLVRKDGSMLIGMVYSSPIIREGKAVGIRGILVDITQLKQVEDDLRKLNEELEFRVAERTKDLAVANRELEAFSYSVSHDLRAPLRAIDGFSSILLNEHAAAFDPTMQEFLEKIRMNAQKMGQLIDSILNFSRMSRQPLLKQKIFPAQMVDEVLEELKPLQKGRMIEVHIGTLLPGEGDPALVKQVFHNLISNALKFTRKRARAKIEVDSLLQGQKTVYVVRDNGIGFDMKYAGKLFSVFERLHDEKEYEGTGIGLAIVYRIIQRHGGKVWVESEVDKGTSFFFTLE